MKDNLTRAVVILDASGSMGGLRQSTVDNMNEFIEEQRAQPGYLELSIYQFNRNLKNTLPLTDIREVQPLTLEDYVPGGMTALLDAMGKVIEQTGKELRETKEENRPGKVLILVITDGAENSSKTYGQWKIADMVDHQKTQYNWDFAFMGANIDSFATAGKLSIGAAATANWQPTLLGHNVAYRSIRKSVSTYRNSGSAGTFSIVPADSKTS